MAKQIPIRCKKCKKRFFDNVSASGIIEVICPRCGTKNRVFLKPDVMKLQKVNSLLKGKNNV